MSFYGNISNASRSSLTYDRVYSNRRQMDAYADKDNVFVGRYVFVEYDDNTYSRREGFIKEDLSFVDNENNIDYYYTIYSDINKEFEYKQKESNPETGYGVLIGDIVFVNFGKEQRFFVFEEQGFKLITISLFMEKSETSDYIYNYAIDKKYAIDKGWWDLTNFKGWDSTVWQKVVENGIFKYVMVSELNADLPRFKTVAEAPSEAPIAPHFDDNSTNKDYLLHAQAPWGFRVKKTDDENSDVDIKGNYTQDGATSTESTYKGAIYFNKDGFDKINRAVSTKENEIILEPTGVSGKAYALHKGENNPKKVDIQELEVNLPSIGNTISEVWDIIYGDYTFNSDGSTTIKNTRNLNLDWEDGKNELEQKGTRLIKRGANGFEYVPQRVETVAGCINSVHDLMGMIIVNDNDSQLSLKDAKEDRIYYRKKDNSDERGFFYKAKKNTYTAITQAELVDDLLTRNWIKLTQYEPEKYYTKNLNKDYYRDDNDSPQINNEISHYEIETSAINLRPWEVVISDDYPINHYFINDVDYIFDDSEVKNANKTYYNLSNITQITSNIEGNKKHFYYPKEPKKIAEENDGFSWYEGYFKVIFDNRGKIISLTQVTSSETSIDQTARYFWIDKYGIEKAFDINNNEISIIVNKDRDPINDDNFKNYEEITMISYDNEANYYYKFNNFIIDGKKYQGYKKLVSIEDMDTSIEYFTFTSTEDNTVYYEPNKYHFKQGYNYIFDSSNTMTGTEYYIITEKLKVNFYVPGKYCLYKIKDKNIIIDYSPFDQMKDYSPELAEEYEYNADLGTFYFLNQEVYVIDDVSKVFPEGSLWTGGKQYPKGMTLGVLYQGEDVIKIGQGYGTDGYLLGVNKITISNEEDKINYQWQWKELIGFSQTLNTINGLILKINQLLRSNDLKTRDRETVQGALNYLNDIINRFQNLIPGEIISVAQNGRFITQKLGEFTLGEYSTGNTEIEIDNNTKISVAIGELERQLNLLNADSSTQGSINQKLKELQDQIDNLESGGGSTSAITVENFFSITSKNPVQNSTITSRFNNMDASINTINTNITGLTERVTSLEDNSGNGGNGSSGSGTTTSSTTTYLVTLSISNWIASDKGYSKTISVPAIVANENSQFIHVTPAVSSQDLYYSNGLYASAQSSGSLTFTCSTIPTSAVSVYIIVEAIGNVITLTDDSSGEGNGSDNENSGTEAKKYVSLYIDTADDPQDVAAYEYVENETWEELIERVNDELLTLENNKVYYYLSSVDKYQVEKVSGTDIVESMLYKLILRKIATIYVYSTRGDITIEETLEYTDGDNWNSYVNNGDAQVTLDETTVYYVGNGSGTGDGIMVYADGSQVSPSDLISSDLNYYYVEFNSYG